MKSKQWATRRNTTRKSRKCSRPTLLEPIEPRVLLSASYAPSDLSGTLVLAGINKSGSLTTTGAGVFSSGSWSNADTSPDSIVGDGSTYTVAPDGTLTAHIVSTQDGVAGTTTMDLAGVINSTKDVAVLNEVTGATPVVNGVDVLVEQNSFFTQSDFTGTWNVVGDQFRGTIKINASGNITGGVISLLSGGSARVTGGTAPLDNDGGGVMTINTTFKGAKAAFSSLSLNFAMNDSKDFVAVQNTNLGMGGSTGMGTMAALIKTSTGNSRGNLTPLTWTINSAQGIGTLTLNSRGGVSGQLTTPDGSTADLTGSLSVGSGGNVTLKLTVQGSGGLSRFTLSGNVNASKNIITLDRTSRSTASSLTFLTTASNHAPTINTKTLFPQAAHIATPFTMGFSDIASAINARDLDNDTLSFVITTVPANNGTLTITSNGATVDVVPGTTVVNAGDVLTWTPSSTAKGKVNAFSVQASDGTTLSTNTARITIFTIPIPVVSMTTSRVNAVEANASSASAQGIFTISRTGSTATDLNVTLSVAGTALAGTNYNLVGPDKSTILTDGSTVTIPARKRSIQLFVVPVQDGAVDPTLTVLVTVAPDPNATSPGYAPGTNDTGTVNIIDSGTVSTSQLAVALNMVPVSNPGNASDP